MTLTQLWFLLIAVLWIGYFVLEGFDFGVGMLLGIVGKDEKGKRVLVNTIGPVWDGNEVWVLTAGGATFAAFPHWYATLFSAAYLPLFIMLACLIVRGVAFEYRGKGHTDTWRRNWDIAIITSSVILPVLWGAAFASIIRGIPLEKMAYNSANHTMVPSDKGTIEFTGTLFSFLTPFALLGGLAMLAIFAFHGAVFLSLKTGGEVRERARGVVTKVGPVAIVLGAAFLIWAQAYNGWNIASIIGLVVAAAGLIAGYLATMMQRDGWAFLATALGILGAVVSLMACLYPNAVVDIDGVHTLSLADASSSALTLQIMTWVAVALVPFVLAYQAWSYWIFRKRLTTASIPDPAPITVGTETS